MIYLICAILCSSAIALIFKYTETANKNRMVITSTNYFIAWVVSLFLILSKGLLVNVTKEIAFFDDLLLFSTSPSHTLSPYSSIVWGFVVGGITGFFFFLSFTYYQKSVKENGVGVSGTIAKLGILIPMIFSIIIWKEYPSGIQ